MLSLLIPQFINHISPLCLCALVAELIRINIITAITDIDIPNVWEIDNSPKIGSPLKSPRNISINERVVP
jgi:hypothetical protein